MNKKKKNVAALSIFSNILLTVLKIFAGILSGSMSIISEAIHSFSDLFASILTFFSVNKSSVPADDDHPFGHGKYEDMAGFIEGLLIILASLFIIFESLKKIVFSNHVENIGNIGIVVMFIAVIFNFFVSSCLFKVAKETDSICLFADAEHLRTDIYSSLGIFLGLILIKITGYYVLDPVIAVIVAIFIFKAGFDILKNTWMQLVDHSLPKEEIDIIKNIIYKFNDSVKLKENSIKARKAGSSRDIDLILQFYEDKTICQCHKICDIIETQIQSIYPNSSISIHSEPICHNENCGNCKKFISLKM